MEIVFELLFELFGELILGLIGEAIGSLFGSLFGTITGNIAAKMRPLPSAGSPADRDAARPAPAKPFSPAAKLLFYLVVGALLGWISIHLFPHSFARHMDTKIAVLIGVPLGCGVMMAVIGEWKKKHGRMRGTLESFGCGLAFALPMAVIRFIWTV